MRRLLRNAAAGLVGVMAVTLLPVLSAWAQGGPVPVTVVPATKRDVPMLLRNIGAVQANQTALIRSRVDGTIREILFEEGQEVRKGDRLALIDERPYTALYALAVAKKIGDQAQLANAQKDLARYRQLATRDFAPQQQLDQQQTTVANLTALLQADDAAIAAAKVNMDYAVITAPFDGVMGLRQQDVGNVIRLADSTGIGIATIAQVHPIAVVFTLPQDTLPGIRAAMSKGKPPVVAYSSDDKALLAHGELLTFDNAIDPATGTIKLKAIFPNADNALWPGQFVNARLQLGVIKGALTVPSSTVQRSQSDLFVYVVKPDNTAAIQKVEIGQDDGQIVVITKGLEEGAQVVSAGQSRLRAGTPVVATPAKPNS